MSEHEKATPRPWQVNGSHIYGPDPDRTLVTQVVTGTGALVADRNLIVAAVNSYDASRALIEQMGEALGNTERALLKTIEDRHDAFRWQLQRAPGRIDKMTRIGRHLGRLGYALLETREQIAAAEKFLKEGQ